MKKRILFVDDEPDVLDGLRRALRKQRAEWEMAFATSGAEALAELAKASFDVIVTDMRMPGMNGVELLERARNGYPETARIILSGETSDEGATHIASVAHQFLFKPIDPERLKEAVTNVCLMRESIRNKSVRTEVSGCDSLPSVPTLYVEITRAAASEHCTLAHITEIVARDMAMTAKLLQLVNSAFFGVGREVNSVERAVSLLGIDQIKAMTLSEHVFTQFVPREGALKFPVEELWRHALLVARIAWLISKEEKQSGDRPDQAFTAGLLHDVGVLVLASRHASVLAKAFEGVRAEHSQIPQFEMDPLGSSHAEVGSYLLSLWGLPPRLVEAVALHHTPGRIEYDGICALTAVHAADALVTTVNEPDMSSASQTLGCELDITYLERIGVANRVERWSELAAEVCEKAMEAAT